MTTSRIGLIGVTPRSFIRGSKLGAHAIYGNARHLYGLNSASKMAKPRNWMEAGVFGRLFSTRVSSIFNINKNTGSYGWSSLLKQRRTVRRFATQPFMEQDKMVKRYAYWMLGIAGMCFGAIVLGGITRLTESGLSMVSWSAFSSGIPRNTQEWLAEYESYKQYPEYSYNKVTLIEFKQIFFWECLHRVWGRTTGLVFMVPYIGFMASRKIPARLKGFATCVGLLIGFQGLLGWYMVKSGLAENDSVPEHNWFPRVSQYRLAAHLGSALTLYLLAFNKGIKLLTEFKYTSGSPHANLLERAKWTPAQVAKLAKLARFSSFAIAAAFVTACSGAFVAGLDAGLVYNEFPWMGHGLIPDDLWALRPWYKNFTTNTTTVQFDHRVLATCVLLLGGYVLGTVSRIPASPTTKRAAMAVAGVVATQYVLGISTLLNYVPVALASAHQTGAVVLLTTLVYLRNDLRHSLKHLRKIVR